MSASYSYPVSELLTFGDCRNFRGWPNYLELGLESEHVTELIEMATDEELNWANSESLEIWAPVHAWRALGQLRAPAAIEPLLRLFHNIEDNDWASDELPEVYGMIGRAAIPALARYLDDASRGLWSRVTAAFALRRIATGDASARAECVEILSQQLERFAKNDPELNGFLISYLIDLRAVEATPSMECAFAADRVDLSIAGDWEDVQVELGLKTARETTRAYLSHFSLFDAPGHEVLR
jgi:HEAT repeat protein